MGSLRGRWKDAVWRDDRFARYMEMEGGSHEEKMLEEENFRGHGLKMGHHITEEED